MHDESNFLGYDTCVHQWANEGDHTSGITARIRDTFRGGHLRGLISVELGKTVRPVVRTPMRAVEASMMTTSGSVTRETASMAASSGRHKMAASAEFRYSARFSRSLRSSPVSEIISMSSRAARRSRTCRPVVPASPSMKTFSSPLRTLPIGATRRRFEDFGRGARVLRRWRECRRSGRRRPLPFGSIESDGKARGSRRRLAVLHSQSSWYVHQ